MDRTIRRIRLSALCRFAHQPIWVYVFTSLEQDFSRLAALPLDTWRYLAASHNNQTLRLYVNGTQIARKALSGGIVNCSRPLRIGANSVWTEYFKGHINEVRISNRGLTSSQIQMDMNTLVLAVPKLLPVYIRNRGWHREGCFSAACK